MNTPFDDPRLELAVRAALPQEVLAQPLGSLTHLDAAERGIRRLGGIAALSELRFANLRGNPLASVVELGANTKLIEVDLSHTQMSTTEGLGGLPDLESVDLYGSRVVDIRGLAGAPALRSLDLGQCRVGELGPLETFTRLESLTLGNPFVHVRRGCVAAIPEAVALDLDPIKGLTSLRQLRLYGVDVYDTSVFENLVHLEELVLEGCTFGDSPEGLARLPRLEYLSLASCELESLTFLAGQTRLRSLVLDEAHIGDLSALRQLEALEQVSLRDAKFEGDAKALAQHPRLRELRVGNRLIDLG